MKTSLSLIVLMLFAQFLSACPACEKQQPQITYGITHGAGPQSNWEWVIVSLITLISLYVLIFSIKYLAFPSEDKYEDIKSSIIAKKI